MARLCTKDINAVERSACSAIYFWVVYFKEAVFPVRATYFLGAALFFEATAFFLRAALFFGAAFLLGFLPATA